MAYEFDALTAIAEGSRAAAGGQRNTIFHYSTNDTHAVVIGANYFDPAAAFLQVGDIIMASCDLDGTPTLRQYMVSAISGAGAVTIIQLANA